MNARSIVQGQLQKLLLPFASFLLAQGSILAADQATLIGPFAQTAADTKTAPDKTAIETITYVGGQLTIQSRDTTLAALLIKVAAVTGVHMDLPLGAGNEPLSGIQLGPGPARQIIASLLADSNFEYVIQDSETDPDKLQSVLILPHTGKGKDAGGADLAEVSTRNPYSRSTSAIEASVAPALPATLDTPVPNASPSPSNPSSPAEQPSLPAGASSLQHDPAALSNPGALTPPASLNSQSMNQQLQQMYQQRVQILQQTRGASPANAQP